MSKREETVLERMDREKQEEAEKWKKLCEEARLSRYAIIRVSERKWAIIEELSIACFGNDLVPRRTFRFVAGWEKGGYLETFDEVTRLRREERKRKEGVSGKVDES